MLEELKKRVFEQNIALVKHGLVVLTWGNVSAIDREKRLVVIKPSGVAYETMKPEDMVVVDMHGEIVEGKYKPSSDTPTHLHLYESFSEIGGVVHTHSTFATAWAQSGKAIPVYGTTHADVFYGSIPCTRSLTESETEKDYELNTGRVITETFVRANYNAMPAVLVKKHGSFVWGKTPEKAVENAVTLEEVAKTAFLTKQLNADTPEMERYLADRHYFRKHGKDAYYGQE